MDNAEVAEFTGKPNGFRPDPGFPERRPRAFPARAALTGVAFFELGLTVLKLFTEGAWAALPFAVLFAGVAALSRLAPPARCPAPRGAAARVEPATLNPARAAWDVSTGMDRHGGTGLWHYEDASRKPGPGADGVIRVIPRSADRPFWSPGTPVVTSWTVVVRAADPEEGTRLLEEGMPLLVPLLAADDEFPPRARYFRLEDGRLADAEAAVRLPPGCAGLRTEDGLLHRVGKGGTMGLPGSVSMRDLELGFARLGPCAHEGAEPVDLVTGERVAWLCPECDAQLPAEWGGTAG